MKKLIIFTLFAMYVLVATVPSAHAGQPQSAITREPYHIRGTVIDADNNAIEDATVIITRLRTGETNLVKADGTPKDNYFPCKTELTTNSQGRYFFDLSNMAQFNDNEKFEIKAIKGDETGTKIVKLDTDATPGLNADIMIEAQAVIDICMILFLIIIILIIIATYKSLR